jgi:LemA protein
MALAEAYPELKADANFRQLQGQLAKVEDQLQMARRYYNGTARDLNTLVQSFPSNLVAGGFGFKEVEFFETDEASRAAPQVSFAR